ncbi:MAG: leucine-rich repeat domain-containing protein, partial [Lachnospiraceae bacterium]|nr:leucine-rich repeat domain-containing protein [Lachnospiraceae bacterium]
QDEETEEIEAKGHEWETEYTIDSAATCTIDGSRSIHCKNCTATKEEGTINAAGHQYGEWVTVTEPGCETKGSRKHICTECQNVETEEIGAKGHDWNDKYTIDKEPTEMEKGQKSIHCKNCDAVKDVTEIPVLDHTHIWNADYTIDVEPTCTVAGSKSIHCSKCNEIKDVQEIKANGHSFGEWQEINTSICGGQSRKRVCNVCGFEEIEESGESNHEWESDYTIDVAATCTSDGSKSIHCKNCDVVKDVTVIPATGHEYGTPIFAWNKEDSTCTATRKCKNDASHEESLECIISENSVPASCIEDGYVEKIATIRIDGIAYQDKKIVSTSNATGHKYGDIRFVWTTDYSGCKAERVCENDQNHVERIDCTVTTKVTAPTCTEKGYTTYTATVKIGDVEYTDQKTGAQTDAVGHSWNSDFTIDKAATETEKGSKSIHCKNCSATKDVTEIPVIKKTSDASTQTPGETEKPSSGDDTKPSTGESKTEPEPVKTVITDTKTNAEIQVTSKSGQTPTAKYMGPADDDAESAVIPDVVKKGNVSYKITEVTKGAFSGSSVEKVTLGKNISKLQSGAFNGSSVNTIYIKSKNLTKKSVKGALKGCKAKNVKIVIKVGKKKDNQKYLKKYKKYFTKKNVGKKVTLKI